MSRPDPSHGDRNGKTVHAPQAVRADRGAWPTLSRADRLAVAVTLGFVAARALPQLPPGICFGDVGDLQLAATTLGIMHPPGYAGFVSLGYLITRIPGVDPAYLVSLGCLGAGLVALGLGLLMQIRLGVNAWIAGALTVALASLPRVWSNLTAPEVYAPSLTFLAAAAYALMRFARLGAKRDGVLASVLWGFAAANRPPVLMTLPFFLIAWAFARGTRERSWRRPAFSTLWIAGFGAALPCAYSLGYLWLRDRPETRYNYIEQYNAETKELPASTDGWRAKLHRVVWHGSAMQFAGSMGNTWAGIGRKLRWLRFELFPRQPVPTSVILCAVIALGAGITYRRCPTGAWLLVGMGMGSVGFVCTYRVYGQAADLLPLLFASAVLGGVALSPLFPCQAGPLCRGAAMAVILITGAAVTTRGGRSPAAARLDAMPYLAELDMRTLPANAVICSMWGTSPPLWYAKHVLTQRKDIDIINALPSRWQERLSEMSDLSAAHAQADRPLFAVSKSAALAGYVWRPYRNLWRLERSREGRGGGGRAPR